MEIWMAYLIQDLWEMCGGFEGIIFCNNGKVVESGWENSGSVVMTLLSYLQDFHVYKRVLSLHEEGCYS